jgi:hypothetical protein
MRKDALGRRRTLHRALSEKVLASFMHNPTRFIRICFVIAMIVAVLALGYPAAFVVQHGWNSAAWSPNLPMPRG